MCRGVCWVEVINCAVKWGGRDPKADDQRGEEPIKEWGLIEHILCAGPWSRKRPEMGLRGPTGRLAAAFPWASCTLDSAASGRAVGRVAVR